MFELRFTERAFEEWEQLQVHSSKAGLIKQIKKTLGYLQVNPRHPSLRTHEYKTIPHPFDSKQKVFEAYAQNNTPSAFRVFWCYGPNVKEITIIAVTPHP